jgi:hypothetical protein
MDPLKKKSLSHSSIDEFRVLQAEEDDVTEAVNDLDGFREYQRESDEGLTFGDL